MANGRSNYGGYGGYGNPFGNFGHLVAGQRAGLTSPTNVMMQYQLGQATSQQQSALRLAEKKLQLETQEQGIIEALGNKSFNPDVSQLSGDLSELTVDPLVAWKQEYLNHTAGVLDPDATIMEKAHHENKRKKLEAASLKMGEDLLNLDNFTQLFMNDRTNLSWSGSREDFLRYVDPNATKRVDQETGTVYITPVGGGKDEEISVKEFMDMFPTTVPNDVIDGLNLATTNNTNLALSGTYGTITKDDPKTEDINEGTKYGRGMYQTVYADGKSAIDLGVTNDDSSSRLDILLATIEDGDFTHGKDFKNDNRYKLLDQAWDVLRENGEVTDKKDKDRGWTYANAQDMHTLRKFIGSSPTLSDGSDNPFAEEGFESLEDEFLKFHARSTVDWATDQEAPGLDPNSIEARTIALKENEFNLKYYETMNKVLPEEAIVAGGLYNRIVEGVMLELQTYFPNGILDSDIENNTPAFQKYKERIQGLLNTISDSKLKEQNFKILTAENYRHQTLSSIDEDVYNKDGDWATWLKDKKWADYDKWITDNNKVKDSDNTNIKDKRANRKEYVKQKVESDVENYELFYSIDQTRGAGAGAITTPITQPFQGHVTNADHLAKAIITIHDSSMLGYLPGEGGLSGVRPSNNLIKFLEKNPTFLKTIKENPMMIKFLETMNMKIPKE